MKTPPRSVRVPDEVWAAATARAASEGTTVTAVILAALIKYGRCANKPGRETTAECPACAGYEDGPYRDLCDSCRAEVLRGQPPTGGDDA